MFARRRWAWYVALGTILALGGCGAAEDLPSEPSPSAWASSAAPTASPSVPDDGITLAGLGFVNGPRDTFSVPYAAQVTDRVDQPNAVTVVMSAPPAAEVAEYYRRALPAAGYTITAADAATSTLTFTGQGWEGALTGSDGRSAVFLRPR